MKLLLPLFLLLPIVLFAQEPKGVDPLRRVKSAAGAPGNPRPAMAVVVGISDYQDASITDLRYAHRDAEIFAEYLKSGSGGQMNEQFVRVLTDREATMAGIQSALEWLLKNVQPGGQVILYFSCHGDVETKNDQEKGYLLAYDTPKNNYRLNAIDLDYLNEHFIGGLSRQGIKVVVIMDACHSGALAGDAAGGREATAMELMKRFSSEVRIMSCQPYEFSLESSRWGDGRGVFSFYLIDGLKGQADEDGDRQVDLFELENFLQNRVRIASAKTQHPDIFGGHKEESLFGVDEAAVAAWQAAGKAAIQRDFEQEILDNLAGTEGYANYVHFNAALSSGRLLEPDGALAWFNALYADTVFIPLRSILEERMSRALLDSAQQALAAYLDTDPRELAQRDLYDQKYFRFAQYLAEAAAILGPKDPRYPQILAKQYYFEGLALRLESEQRGGSDSLYRLAQEKQNQAFELENRAAYIFNELGFLHLKLDETKQGMAFLRKAVAFSPTWAIAHNNLAVGYKLTDSLELAKVHYSKAIELKPDFASAYANLGNLLDALDLPDSAEIMYRKAIEYYPADKDNYYNLGVLLSALPGRQEAARAMYLRALQLDPRYPEAWLGLGMLCAAGGNADSAEMLLLKAVELNPRYAEACQNLVVLYQNQWDKAVDLLRKTPLDTVEKMQILWNAGFELFRMQASDQALKAFQLAVDLDPADPAGYYVLATYYTARGQESEALDNLEKALEKAGGNAADLYELISTDTDLDALRQTRRFRYLMKHYFPDRR